MDDLEQFGIRALIRGFEALAAYWWFGLAPHERLQNCIHGVRERAGDSSSGERWVRGYEAGRWGFAGMGTG